MSNRDFSIISYEDFKKKTNAIIGGRKSLALVDSKLKEYNQIGKNAGNSAGVILRSLAAACKSYVEKKEQKTQTKGASELLVKRVEAVKALLAQVYQRLIYLRYEDRKSNLSSNEGTLSTAPRVELGTVYKYERQDFLEKKQILGAKGLPNLQVNPTGAGYVKDQVEYGTKWNNIPETIKHIANKPPNTWTFEDYKEIGKCFPVTIVNNPIVHFIRKDERLRHWMLYPDEGKLYTSHGVLADFSSYLYALDTYGNLIANDGESFGGKVKAVNKQDINEHGQANHSSLCAGRAVICAGMITIKKGYIEKIDNCSGHYAPKPHQLSRAIQILIEEYNLDLPRTLTSIRVLTGGNRESNFNDYQAFANAFPLIK